MGKVSAKNLAGRVGLDMTSQRGKCPTRHFPSANLKLVEKNHVVSLCSNDANTGSIHSESPVIR